MNTVVADLRTHLPLARRFARALCGSQESGDAYIAQTLETLIAAPSTLESYSNRRIALYGTFLKLWNSIAINSSIDTPVSANPAQLSADKNLQALSPRSRQAFLLVSMEGFTMAETAEVLDVEPTDVSQFIEEATYDIANQIATGVLIIEDEPLVAMDLEATMQEIGHHVVGIASTKQEAVKMAAEKRPGLVLADIQLADGSSGIDAVKDMMRSFEAAVIFITAYPERLLTGEKPEPAFLITKPFDPNVVKAISSQALFFDQKVGRNGAAA